MTQILVAELQTYEQQRETLLGTSEGKFVLIHGTQVVGIFDSKMDAIAAGYQQFGNVPFLVKEILRGEAPLDLMSNYSFKRTARAMASLIEEKFVLHSLDCWV
jgi:hypothetical protein